MKVQGVKTNWLVAFNCPHSWELMNELAEPLLSVVPVANNEWKCSLFLALCSKYHLCVYVCSDGSE